MPRDIFNNFSRLSAQASLPEGQTDVLLIDDHLHDSKFDPPAGGFLFLVELSSLCELRILV